MSTINKRIFQIYRLLSGGDPLTSSIPNEAYTNDSIIPEELEDKDIHEGYLWLLILDLLIFIGLTFTSYSSSKKLNLMNPDDFKTKFIRGLIYANGSNLYFKK